MYLRKEVYIGANYEHRNVNGVIDLKSGDTPIKVELSKVSSVIEHVGYWRKANAIHKWFVDNVQDGVDDCETYDVSFKKLVELRELCVKSLEEKTGDYLPPQEGFFFGGTDIDEDYFNDLRNTIEILNSLDPEGDYQYQSSW